jgi:PAT family beta-lactamase induction signal transducer AmpG
VSETAPAAASPEGVKPRRSRAEWSVFGLGFASGLPYAILVGSLGVWIANAGLSFSVIGALSWIGLFYAFKFIWAPAFDWLVPPFANTVGRRRAWMAMCQVVVALGLFGMTFVDPRDNIVMFALFAVLAGFASASQDIVIDAWRIETAEDQKMLDRMSVQYQMGYRLAALLGGIAALLLTDMWRTAADAAAGWPPTMIILSIMMAVAALTATWMAPEPLFRPPVTSEPQDADTHSLRRRTAIPVAAGWALSALLLLGFMFYTLANPSANAVVFRDAATPWILLLTIGAPLALSFWLVKRKPGVIEAPMQRGSFFDAMFERVLAPMADVVRRYWLWALPILLLAMTYRIADSIWGSFAQPFYVRILGYSNSDLAVAQKLVGVAMTMGGIALGGLGVKLLGRVNALILGAVLAAVTNLLYVDLAYGGAWADGFLQVTGLGSFLSWVIGGLVGWVNSTGATVFAAVNPGQAINRLTVVIAMENLAGGFASAVHLVWLSSIVNKRYAAVQYALFGSLALLIGVIFRPKIGEYVDAVKDAGLQAQAARFADVFNLAMYIGFFAVALCVVELYRQAQEKKRLAAAGLAPVAAE